MKTITITKEELEWAKVYVDSPQMMKHYDRSEEQALNSIHRKRRVLDELFIRKCKFKRNDLVQVTPDGDVKHRFFMRVDSVTANSSLNRWYVHGHAVTKTGNFTTAIARRHGHRAAPRRHFSSIEFDAGEVVKLGVLTEISRCGTLG